MQTHRTDPHSPMTAVRRPKRATHVSLSEDLVAEARSLGISISAAAEAGLVEAVAGRRAEVWSAENRRAIDSSNAFSDANELPLAPFRSF